MQSTHASPVSPLFALPELPIHGKVPSPQTQTLALDALTSSFGFPEPPARTPQRMSGHGTQGLRRTSPPPSGIAVRRKQHGSKLHLIKRQSKESGDGASSPRKSPRSPHSPPPMPPSPALPLGASSLGSEKGSSAAYYDAHRAQERSEEEEPGTLGGGTAREQQAVTEDQHAQRQDGMLAQGEDAKERMGSLDSQASSASGSQGQGTSRTSGSGISPLRTTGLSDRHESLHPSPALSTSSSSTGDLDETLDHEIDGEGTDGSAGAMSFSSDGDYAVTPVTPATPAMPDMHALSTAGAQQQQHQQHSQWRPRELHLPQRTGPSSERERAIASLTVRSPVVSRSTSPSFAHSAAAAAATAARLSPVTQIASPQKVHTRAAPSTSSASGSAGSGTTLPSSGSSGPRGLLLAGAAAPPGSARIKPSLSTSSLTSGASTPTREPSFGYNLPPTPRSPLPVLSSSTPAFPPTPSATVESMAAGRVPNDQLFALPTRPGSNSLSPLSIVQNIPSPLGSGSVSPIASAPSWEMPPRDSLSVREPSPAYSPPATSLEPSEFAARVEALEQERIKEHSTAATTPSEEQERPSLGLIGRSRSGSGSGSFASAAASTRRTNSRRKPPPAPLLLVRIPASPDTAQFSPSAHSALPSALHVFHTPQSSPRPLSSELLEADAASAPKEATLGSSLRASSLSQRVASPPPTPFYDFDESNEDEQEQEMQEPKLFRQAEAEADVKAEAVQVEEEEEEEESSSVVSVPVLEEAEAMQGSSEETLEAVKSSVEPEQGSVDSVQSDLTSSVKAVTEVSTDASLSEAEDRLSASEKTSRMASVSSATSSATGDDAFEFDEGSDDDAAESLMLSGATSEMLESIEPRPTSALSNDSDSGNVTDPGVFSSTDSSYSQSSVAPGMTPSSSGVSFRTSIFQNSQQSPRVDRFGPRGTPDITRGRVQSQYSSSSSRPPSQSAPMGPPPSGPLPTLPPSTPSSPGKSRVKSIASQASVPLARVTSYPGLAKSTPALPTQPVPSTERRGSSPPPSRPRRPSEGLLLDMAPPRLAAHLNKQLPTPNTAPLPQSEWQPSVQSTATRASMSGPSSPDNGLAPMPHSAPPDRLRPELSVRTDTQEVRPRPPVPVTKRSIVPDVPTFGYMGGASQQGVDSGPVSPIGSGAPPTPSGFSVFSEESSSEHGFVGMSSRWSSGSESDGESKASAKSKAAKGKKNAPAQRKSMRTSVTAPSGSMPPPAVPSSKKPNFLSGFGLRKKSFSNAAQGPSSSSLSQRSNSPLTPGTTAASPAPTDGSYEFPFPSNVTSSAGTSGMPSAWGPNRASQLGGGEQPRSRTGSMVSRLSGAGQLLKTKQSSASLRASSTEANRRPSLSADHLAGNGWPTPPSASTSYDSAALYYDSQRRPSLGATSVTGLGIDVDDAMNSVSPTTASALSSVARASQGSRLSSGGMRSTRASFTNLRASRDASPLASPAAESPGIESSASRQRSMPSLANEARASRQTLLPSIAASRRPSFSEEKAAHAASATSSDELEETPRVAYAMLPGSQRNSASSPPVALMNTSRYFHSDAEGLTALGTAFTTWRDDESLPPSLPTSPTVPIPMRVGSLRKAHQRTGSKSSSLVSSISQSSSTDSSATYPGRALSPPVAPSPRSTSLRRPRRVLEREEVSARPRYTSLTDMGRAWQQANPNVPLEGAVGPKLLAAAIAPRTHAAGQHTADASGATTPSDATDYYGSSDGGGGGGRDASEGDEQGSSSGSGTGSGGDGGKDPNDGDRPPVRRSDIALESSSEESDEYGSDDEETVDASKTINASGLSSRSESSDDVPLGERVQNAAALQKRLRDQERKAQIETARSALERGGRTSKSDRAAARKMRGQVREAPPDASPLDALDLIARLQKVQLMQQQQLEPTGVPSSAVSKPASSAPQLRAQPGRARANTLRSADPRAPVASATAPAVPTVPQLSPQHRVSPQSNTVPLPTQQPGQQRSSPALTQAKLQYMQQQQLQQQQQQMQMQNAANASTPFRSASGPMRHRPSVGADGQTEHRPPVATMMIPSTGSSPTPSSPAFSTSSLPHSSKMAAVVGQANFPMPPPLAPGLGMQGIPQHYTTSTTPSSDAHGNSRGGGSASMDTAATVAVATSRLRARSVSRARPPQGIDARIAPPLPLPSLARPPQPPQHSSSSPTSAQAIAAPLPSSSQSNEPPRASTESGRPSMGGAPSPSSTVASLAPNANPQLMQHRVYIATRQRFGTALIAQGGRARDLVLDIMAKEYVPTDSTGGGWVVFDCSPEWGIERPLREYEMISDVVDARPTPDDYFLLKRTELSPYLSFRAVPTSSPLLAGYVYVQDAKRKWNKRWLELREHSLFHAKSDKGKDEVFVCSLSAFDAYLVDSTKIKAPKPHAFAVRSQNKITMFEKQADYIHYFCLGDPAAHRDWVRAILNACTYILKQERAALFVPPVRALNNGSNAPSSDGPVASPEGQSRSTDSPLVARSGTTASHHTPRNVEQRPMRSATMDARVVGAADAGVFTGPFEKGSLLASAAAKQAVQQGDLELSLHERTARARQTEAARRAELADRMRQARAGGQPLIDVAAREGAM